jgi:hypothetical protein
VVSPGGDYRRYQEQGVLRPPEEPAALVWWLATPMAAQLRGEVVSIDDRIIQQRLVEDLGVPALSQRDG